MTINDLPPAVREALALHESLRRLSFIPADIYVRLTEDRLWVVARRDDKEFNAFAGHHTIPPADFARVWKEASHWWNATATEPERIQIFEGSNVCSNSVSFVMALLDKGFVLKDPNA